MPAMSLLLSLVVLIGAFVAARPDPKPVRWGAFVIAVIPATILPSCICFVLPAVWILAASLAISLGFWPRARKRVPSFVPFALAGVLISFALTCWFASRKSENYDRLREQYPLESMEDRVPVPRKAISGEPVQIPDASQAEFDDKIEPLARHRGLRLRSLHEDRFRQFVNSSGFGVGRMSDMYDYMFLNENRTRAPRQHLGNSAGAPKDGPPLSASDEPGLLSMHKDGLLEFVNPMGFGYVKNRREVAGFQSHAFDAKPQSSPEWSVDRIDLIGLLRHPEPVAYVSEELPAMDKLKDAPTRRLDSFELAGLDAIRGGQMIFVGSPDDRPRMLGAIRSMNQCVGCHGGERGDLLGAFSYALRPAGKDK